MIGKNVFINNVFQSIDKCPWYSLLLLSWSLKRNIQKNKRKVYMIYILSVDSPPTDHINEDVPVPVPHRFCCSGIYQVTVSTVSGKCYITCFLRLSPHQNFFHIGIKEDCLDLNSWFDSLKCNSSNNGKCLKKYLESDFLTIPCLYTSMLKC